MKRVPYVLAISSLMHAMVYTGPNITYAVEVVSKYMNNLDRQH